MIQSSRWRHLSANGLHLANNQRHCLTGAFIDQEMTPAALLISHYSESGPRTQNNDIMLSLSSE